MLAQSQLAKAVVDGPMETHNRFIGKLSALHSLLLCAGRSLRLEYLQLECWQTSLVKEVFWHRCSQDTLKQLFSFRCVALGFQPPAFSVIQPCPIEVAAGNIGQSTNVE